MAGQFNGRNSAPKTEKDGVLGRYGTGYPEMVRIMQRVLSNPKILEECPNQAYYDKQNV